jgi:hypothetical protein
MRPPHTNSDISVHFTNADIFHAADTSGMVLNPFIDYLTGGSIDGQIQAAETNLGKERGVSEFSTRACNVKSTL